MALCLSCNYDMAAPSEDPSPLEMFRRRKDLQQELHTEDESQQASFHWKFQLGDAQALAAALPGLPELELASSYSMPGAALVHLVSPLLHLVSPLLQLCKLQLCKRCKPAIDVASAAAAARIQAVAGTLSTQLVGPRRGCDVRVVRQTHAS